MNKKTIKIAGWALGLSMAVAGIGAAASSKMRMMPVHASPTSVTYAQTSTSEASVSSGTAPTNSSVSFTNSYTTKEQLTNGNSMTYTLSGYAGYKITAITLSMKSNKSSGSGTFSAVAGSTSLASISTNTAFSSWYNMTAFTQSYTNVNVTMNNDDYTVQNNENIVITISCPTGKSNNSLYCQSVTLTYESASTNPLVSISTTGNSTRMVNKDGSDLVVTGISASSSNFTSGPVYTWSASEETNCSVTITGNTATPAISVNYDAEGFVSGSFKIGVTADNATDDEHATADEITINLVPFGGSISWTSRSSLTFKQGLGWDFSTTTITTTMNDGTVINYAGDFSNIHLYSGDAEVDSASVDATYCSTSRSYKLYDSENNAFSTSSSTTLKFMEKASVELMANGGISTIEPGQVLYLKSTIGSGWGNSVSSYSSSATGVATVDEDGKVTGVAAGEATITVTLENGETDTFDVTVANSVVYTPTQMVGMLSQNSISSNNNYYQTKTTTSSDEPYTVKGYYKEDASKDYLYTSSSLTGDRVQLYNLSSNGTGKTFSEGCLVTATGAFLYYGGPELKNYTVNSIADPAAESFEISGGSEVYKGENLTLSVTNFSPASASQTVTWDVDDKVNASITSAGVFSATASGVYTVTAISTTTKEDSSHASAEIEISVFEYQETIIALKAAPKTTYYTGESVEAGLVNATIKYKCGETLNYKSEVVDASNIAPTFKYDGAALSPATFVSAHAAATLSIPSVTVESEIMPDTISTIVEETDLAVNDVAVVENMMTLHWDDRGTQLFTIGDKFSLKAGASLYASYTNPSDDEVALTPSAAGVEVLLSGEAINVSTYAFSKSDNGKTLAIRYTDPSSKVSTTTTETIRVVRSVIEGEDSTGEITFGSSDYSYDGNAGSLKTENGFATSGYTTYEKASSTNTIRLGSGSNKGYVTVTLSDTSAKITSITINAMRYGSDANPELKITSGGTTSTKTIGSSFGDYTLDIAEANRTYSFTLETTANSKRVNISSITFNVSDREDLSQSTQALALDLFINESMHMDYTENLGYCKDDEHHYYSTAKAAFNALSDEARALFVSNAAYEAEYARLQAWADANGDKFGTDAQDHENTLISKAANPSIQTGNLVSFDSNPAMLALISIGFVSLGGAFLIARRRKED